MKPFAISFEHGASVLGLGLSSEDIQRIKAGEHVTIDLSSIDVGLWTRDQDKSRRFHQPRDSKVIVIAASTKEEIGEFLKVDLG